MDTVRRRSAGIPVVVAAAVVLGLLALFTHSSPHPASGRSVSLGSILHGCTLTPESGQDAGLGGLSQNPETPGSPHVTTASIGTSDDAEPHPTPLDCLAVLIAIAVGVLLGFAVRALPSRRWILPPPSTLPVVRPRTALCLPTGRLALCSRLLL